MKVWDSPEFQAAFIVVTRTWIQFDLEAILKEEVKKTFVPMSVFIGLVTTVPTCGNGGLCGLQLTQTTCKGEVCEMQAHHSDFFIFSTPAR